jgi:hypothetical protein
LPSDVDGEVLGKHRGELAHLPGKEMREGAHRDGGTSMERRGSGGAVVSDGGERAAAVFGDQCEFLHLLER